MALIFFSQIIYLLLGLQIYLDIIKLNIISKKNLAKIGTLQVISLFFLNYLFSKQIIIFHFVNIIITICLYSTQFILNYLIERRFRYRFSEYLTKIILKMQMGHSFRQSLSLVLNESDFYLKKKFQQIIDIVTFSQQVDEKNKGTFLEEIVEEFKLIDHQPHKSLKHLKNYQRKIKTENDFRRKSGQVVRQIRIQSYILTVLYLLTFIFVIYHYGFSNNYILYTISVTLFFIGLAWIAKSGGKRRWKV